MINFGSPHVRTDGCAFSRVITGTTVMERGDDFESNRSSRDGMNRRGQRRHEPRQFPAAIPDTVVVSSAQKNPGLHPGSCHAKWTGDLLHCPRGSRFRF